ncbi:MAG: hypothetical protein AAFO07_24300, partial [Bacteroidota bacterium]
MARFFFSLLIVVIITFSSCNTESTDQGKKDYNLFFDLEAYFEQEADRLEGNAPKVIKKVSFNGEEEIQELDDLNFNVEFAPFRASNINLPSFSDKYKADTIYYENGNLKLMSYTALDDKSKTRTVELNHNENGALSEIIIENKVGSFTQATNQVLKYTVGKKIEIKTEQSVLFADAEKLNFEIIIQ